MTAELHPDVKAALEQHGEAIEKAIEKYDGQIKEYGQAQGEVRAEVLALTRKFEEALTEIHQKIAARDTAGAAQVAMTAGDEFVKSEAFKQFVAGNGSIARARLEVKNTVTATGASNTVFETQRPGIIPGSFVPLTVRQAIPSIPVTGNAVKTLRELSWTNSAAEVSETASKKESDLTFEDYDVVIQVVAHWIKVTNQLLQDAPAVVAYINTRLRDGLAQRIDRQLVVGDGTSPNLSGLTDSGNYTAYSLAASNDTLVDGINKAKYAMWAATGVMPDTAIVNPADWGAMERQREGAGSGAYLYGQPGVAAGINPFGVRIVLTPHVTAGNMIVAALNQGTVIYDRQGAMIEAGYVNEDFTKNLVTLRAEERLALAVERPTLVYYGDFES